MAEPRKRGFSSMDKAKQREIASKGGKAAHVKGTAHQFTTDEARVAGRKGGAASKERRKRQFESPRQNGESHNHVHVSGVNGEPLASDTG